MLRTFWIALSLVCFPVVSAANEPWPEQFDWGTISVSDEAIYFHINSRPDNGVIKTPRLYNSYKQLYLQSDESKTALKFLPEVDHWLITLPSGANDSPVVVMETVGKPRWYAKPPKVVGKAERPIRLPAALATVHGEKLRFEPQPHKNTVGYWTVEEDSCHWTIEVPAAGRYSVHVWQGCGTDQGGSEVEIAAGQSRLTFIVEDTGHFQNFKRREVGSLDLDAGEQSLTIRPVRKANKAVMDVRLVVLKPTP